MYVNIYIYISKHSVLHTVYCISQTYLETASVHVKFTTEGATSTFAAPGPEDRLRGILSWQDLGCDGAQGPQLGKWTRTKKEGQVTNV